MRKICIVSGSRAEFGFLVPLMKEIKKDKNLELQILITGSHLSIENGLTIKEIEEFNFKINQKIDLKLKSNNKKDMTNAIAKGLNKFPEAFEVLKPDLIVVIGDRFEILSVVLSAYIHKIPVLHISGGELTYGSLDDGFRHSITKFSSIHCTSTELYRKRVIQMGENPSSVFYTGEIDLENIKKMSFYSQKELENLLSFKFKNDYKLLITYHPLTIEGKEKNISEFSNILKTLEQIKNTDFVFTGSNSDTYGKVINKMIKKFISKNQDKSVFIHSMGRKAYLSMLKISNGVIGNSSSGIIEAPSFGIGSINIGNRQKGRVKAESVIDSDSNPNILNMAFKKLFSDKFQKSIKNIKNPYEKENSVKEIIKILKNYPLENINYKEFYDLNYFLKTE